jgi:hypothetical protein
MISKQAGQRHAVASARIGLGGRSLHQQAPPGLHAKAPPQRAQLAPAAPSALGIAGW